MATITSSTTQNLSATAFVNGDQVVVTSGTLTWDVNGAPGTSPPSTPDGASSFQPTLSASAGGTLTSLPTGSYNLCYTNVDSSGKESSRSCYAGNQTWTNGVSKPRVTLPALPSGVSSRNIYLTAAGGADGTETLYATGVTGTTYDLVSASWTDGTTTQAAAAAIVNRSAIQINSGCAVIVGAGVTLTAKGDIRCSNGSLTLASGATIVELDASGATSPSNTRYAIWLGTAGGQTSARLTTSGSGWIIRSNASGGNGFCGVPYSAGAFGLYHDCGWYTLGGTGTFTRMGTASIDAITMTAIDSANATGNSFSGVTFDSTCGRVNTAYSMHAGTPLVIADCVFATSLNTPLRFLSASSPSTARSLTRVVFSAGTPAISPLGLTVTGCYFHAGWTLVSTGTKWTTFEKSLLRYTGTAGLPVSGDVSNCFIFEDASVTNPHVWTPSGTPGNLTITSSIYEFTGSDTDGDFFYAADNATYTMRNVITLPNGAGNNAGTPFNINSSGKIDCEHCTFFANEQSPVINDFGNGTAGMVVSYKSNIIWSDDTSLSGGLARLKLNDMGHSADPTTNPTSDPVASSGAAADYNSGWNCRAGSLGGGYNVNQVTGTLGAHDIDGNPGFVDSSRNFASWAVAQGSASGTTAGKISDGLGYLRTTPTLTYSSLLPYIQAGFAPTNVAIKDAGHDGVTIGAVEGQFGGSTPFPARRRFRNKSLLRR